MIKWLYRFFFGEPNQGGFIVQSVKYHTRQKGVTPENAKWREIETEERSVEVILVSSGEPSLAGLDAIIRKGSVVNIVLMSNGNSKQRLSPAVKEKTIPK